MPPSIKCQSNLCHIESRVTAVRQNSQQVALIAHAKAPEYSRREYGEAIQQCIRLGKDPTHSKRPMKVVFKPGHEKMRDGLIGGSLHLSQVNKEPI
jgi:hypothetical protein